MKKLPILFLCLLLLIAPVPVSASSQVGTLIELPELYMTLRLPADWVYLTRGEVSDRSVMERDFADLDALHASMPEGNIYLIAQPPDYWLYSYVYMEESDESRKYWDMSSIADDNLLSEMEDYISESISDDDVITSIVSSRLLDRNSLKFIELVSDIEIEINNTIASGQSVIYITIANGQAFGLSCAAFGSEITQAHKNAMLGIIDTIVFTTDRPSPPQTPGPLVGYVLSRFLNSGLSGVLSALIVCVGIGLLAWRNTRKKKEPATENAPQPAPSSMGVAEYVAGALDIALSKCVDNLEFPSDNEEKFIHKHQDIPVAMAFVLIQLPIDESNEAEMSTLSSYVCRMLEPQGLKHIDLWTAYNALANVCNNYSYDSTTQLQQLSYKAIRLMGRVDALAALNLTLFAQPIVLAFLETASLAEEAPPPEEYPPPAPLTFEEPPEELLEELPAEAPATPTPKSKPGQRFCSRCGSPITREDMCCPGCGRRLRLFAKGSVPALLLSLFLVASLVANGFLLYNSRTNLALEKELDDANQLIATLQERNGQLSLNYTNLFYERDTLQRKMENSRWQIEFMDEYVAIVQEDDNRYHTYGCTLFLNSDTSFYIYDVESAPDFGYVPCPYCQ